MDACDKSKIKEAYFSIYIFLNEWNTLSSCPDGVQNWYILN